MDERLPGVAMELVKMKVDVLVKAGRQAATAAQKLPLNCFQLPSV
jgi:ketol-acid reductoisomerase